MRVFVSALRRDPRLGTGARNALQTIDNWAGQHLRGPLVSIEVEAPVTIADSMNMTPTADGKGYQTPDGAVIPGAVVANLQKAADAWLGMTPEARAAVGQWRVHLHTSGAVVVQPVTDRTRRAPKLGIRLG